MATTKEVAKTTASAGAIAAYDYGEHNNAGFENTTQDDFSIPFLDILQGQSPELESLPSAKPGMFHNTVTDDLFDGKEGVSVVVVATNHEYVEWIPRNRGGGIVGRHDVNSPIVEEARRNAESFNDLKTKDGNELVETFYAYLILNGQDGPTPIVLSNSSTRIKPYKAMMTKANMIMVPTPDGRKIKPPLFAHKFRLTTEKRRNNDGEWHTYVVSFDSPDKSAAGARLAPDDPLFQAAVAFYEVIKAGAFTTNDAGEAKSRDNADLAGDTPF